MVIALAAIVGYLVGMWSPATFISKRKGIDIRTTGSGNPGATNAGRALGRKFGVIVALLDVAKGALPAVAFSIPSHHASLVAGGAAVLGHVTSPLLRGRGGKGVATAFGAILGSHPAWAPVVLGVWVAVMALSRVAAVASVSGAAATPVVAVALGSAAADVAWACALFLVIAVRHVSNAQRWWRARRA